MSEASPTSYYEIALTNRQVLTAFVILLVCVVVAFFAGVWVGHEGVAGDSGVEVGDAGGGSSSDGFRFFGDGEDAAAAARSGEQAAARDRGPDSESEVQEVIPTVPGGNTPPKTARKRAGRGNERESAASDKAPVQPPPSLPPVAGALSGSSPAPKRADKPVQPRETPAAVAPVVAETTTPASAAESSTSSGAPDASAGAAAAEPEPDPAPAKPKTVDPPPMSELTVIQVFSTPEESQARAVLARLKEGGYRAFLSPVQVDGNTMYRVRVGPFADAAVAESQAKELKTNYRLDTWITH